MCPKDQSERDREQGTACGTWMGVKKLRRPVGTRETRSMCQRPGRVGKRRPFCGSERGTGLPEARRQTARVSAWTLPGSVACPLTSKSASEPCTGRLPE